MKWGLRGPRGWVALGVTPNSEIGALSLRDWHNLPRPARAVGVNVAGEAARVRIEAQLARWRLTPEWLTASDAACGVTNRYAQPGAARRGPVGVARRRMAALDGDRSVSAGVRRRQRGHGGHHRRARRGRRLPRRTDPSRDCGSCCSRSPRTRRASRCRRASSGRFPDNTADAIYTGAVQAVCGAIEQMRRQIDADPGHVRCYLAGGAAPEIGLHLDPPVEVIDNLVLEGVLALAGEMQ